MSRAQKLLELVLDLGRNEGEVQYGDNRVLFCFHSAVAFSNRDGNVYVTTDPVADNVKAMIKDWAAGRPMQSVDQATITRLTYTLARSMESVEVIELPTREISKLRISVNPSSSKRMLADLGKVENPSSLDLRLMLDASNRLYVWESWYAIHQEVADSMGISWFIPGRCSLGTGGGTGVVHIEKHFFDNENTELDVRMTEFFAGRTVDTNVGLSFR